jgi:hypothetical protein
MLEYHPEMPCRKTAAGKQVPIEKVAVSAEGAIFKRNTIALVYCRKRAQSLFMYLKIISDFVSSCSQ